METTERDLQLDFYSVKSSTGSNETSSNNTVTKYHSDSDADKAKEAFKKELETESASYEWDDNGQYSKTTAKWSITKVENDKKDGKKVQEVDPKSADTETKLYKYTVTYSETKTPTTVSETFYFSANKDVSGSTVKIGNTNTTVRLDYITFNRQVYHPNEIVADLVFGTAPTATDLQDLLKTKVRLLRTERSSSSGTSSTKETFYGFYVHDIKPLKVAGQNLYVRLHIYSLDHQLTRRKYSRTYVGSRLFSDILLSGCSLDDGWKKGAFDYNSYPLALPFPFATYFKIDTSDASKIKTFSDLDHLSATISSPKPMDIERIQPYLVQYNESFYEFIARTANRCGEFFFWDDGTLRFGRPSKGSDTIIKDADCLSIYYTAFDGDNKSDFENDYLTIDDRNNSLDATPDHNYDNTTDNYDLPSQGSGYYYDDEVNHDVYRTKLHKDKFDSWVEEMFGNWRKYFTQILLKLFNSHSIYEFVQNFISTQTMAAILAGMHSSNTNVYYNKYHLFNDKRLNATLRKDSSVKDNETLDALFTALDTNGHVDSSFYHLIRKGEEAVSKEMIVFNLAQSKLLRLGQEITYKVNDSDTGTSYIIVQIKDKPATNSAKGSRFAALDAASEAPFNDMGDAVMQVIAVPKYSYKDGTTPKTTICPPMRPEGHIRRAEPQKAIVSDFLDPQHQGRVRIKYPWQNTEETEASPWIPVLTPSSTPESGCSFELAKDDEVLVDYESGNVERPYVCGTLFNRKNHTHFRRGDMTLISKNGHGICFDDPVDSWKFSDSFAPFWGFIHEWCHDWEFGSLNELRLTGGTTISDEYGFYKIAMSTDQRKIDISSPLGQVNIDAFTGITINAPNGDINIKGQNINIEAGNAIKITSGTNVNQIDYIDSNGKGGYAILESVGKGFADVVQPLVSAVDLDFVRKLFQVFFRPIDGTLEIKSHQYLLLEAGKGEATVKRDRYKDEKKPKELKNLNVYYAGLEGAINMINTKVNDEVTVFETNYDNLQRDKRAYDTARGNVVLAGKLAGGAPTAADIISTEYAGGNVSPAVADYNARDMLNGAAQGTYDAGPGSLKTAADALKTAADTLAAQARAYFSHIKQNSATAAPGDHPFDNNHIGNSDATHVETKYYNILKGAAQVDAAKAKIVMNNFISADTDKNTLKAHFKAAKIAWFKALLNALPDDPQFPYTITANDDWQTFVNELKNKPYIKYDNWRSLGKELISGWTSIIEQFSERDHWKTGEEGQIIISNNPAKSFTFNQDGTPDPYTNEYTKENANLLAHIKVKLHDWD